MGQFALAALLLPVGIASAVVFDAGDAPGAKAVEAWAAQLDAGRQEAAWSSAAADFREGRDPAAWAAADRQLRASLGEIACRTVVMHRAVPDLPGAQDFRIRVVGERGAVVQEQYRVMARDATAHAVAAFTATVGPPVDPAQACGDAVGATAPVAVGRGD
jgi:hypothetical protein